MKKKIENAIGSAEDAELCNVSIVSLSDQFRIV